MKYLKSTDNIFIAENDEYYFYGIRIDKLYFIKPKKKIPLEYSIELVELYNGNNTIYDDFLTFKLKKETHDSYLVDFFFSNFTGGFDQKINSAEKCLNIFNLIIKLFKLSRKRLIGFVGEILFISTNPNKYIPMWHANGQDIFDFYDANEVYEIKTTTNILRIHEIKNKQLNELKIDRRETYYISIQLICNNPDSSIHEVLRNIKSNLSPNLKNILETKLEDYEEILSYVFEFNFDNSINSICKYDSKFVPAITETHNSIMSDSISYKMNFNLLDL